MSAPVYGTWQTSDDLESWEDVGEAVGDRIMRADGSSDETWQLPDASALKTYVRIRYGTNSRV